MPRLVINPNTSSAWEVQLKPGTNLLGRGFSNDFKIENPSVSGSHCQIVLDGGKAILKDLGSTNGTFVNRAPVSEAVLQPGQTIHLGGVEILFQGDSAPIAKPAETEMIPRPAMPPPLAGAAPRAVTPTALPSIQAADGIPLPPPPTAVPAAPPRPPGLSLSARPAEAHRGTPAPALPAPVAIAAAVPVQASPMGGPAVVGGGNCKFHPRTLGRYLCNSCHHYFCELCVASRTVGAEQHKFCRHCGTELSAVQVKVTYQAPKSFFSQVPGAFIYPLKGFGPLVLIISAIVILGLRFFTPGVMRYGYIPETVNWTLIFRVITMGYFFAFMQSIIHSTAIGEDEMAGLPSMSNFWEDVILPGLQFIGLTLISFGPALGIMAYMVFGPGSDEGGGGALIYALIAAFIFGIFYFPMAFLAVAMLDTVLAANPVQIVPSIFRVPLEYAVTCVVLGIVAILPPIGNWLILFMFPEELHTRDMGPMFGYLGAIIFWRLFGLYLMVVGVRILGLLFRSKRDKLSWID